MIEEQTKDSYNVVDVLALVYLTIPLILFILGWIRCEYAYPISAVLLTAICYSVYKRTIKPFRFCLFKSHIRDIGLSVFLMAAVMFLAGVTGNWQQHNDYPIRNDIFIDLITKSWPPSLEDGKYFIYYFQTWLPASLVGWIAGWKAAQWAYYFWIIAGCLFILYYTFKAVNRISFWVALAFLIWNGLELVPCSLIAPFTRGIAIIDAYEEYNHVAEPYVCFGPAFSLRSISHCFVPIAIICGMILNKNLVRNWGVYLGIQAVLYSPMAAIFMLPCLVYLYLRDYSLFGLKADGSWNHTGVRDALSPLCSPLSVISYIILAVVIVPFYMSASPASPFLLEKLSWISLLALAFYLFWNVGIAMILARMNNKDNLLWVAFFSYVMCMLASACINNDMAMKGSAIFNYYLLVLFLQAAFNAPRNQKKWYVVYGIAACYYLIHVQGAGIIALLGVSMYFLLKMPRRYQLAAIAAGVSCVCAVWFIKPSIFNPTLDKLAGKRQKYSKNIGIYQEDGGSGRWWWYKTFPQKEEMPRQFKQY